MIHYHLTDFVVVDSAGFSFYTSPRMSAMVAITFGIFLFIYTSPRMSAIDAIIFSDSLHSPSAVETYCGNPTLHSPRTNKMAMMPRRSWV